MPVEARRIFRVSLIVALSLAGAYALVLPLPYLAPMFAFLLSAKPAPPMGLKDLLVLIMVILITMGVGLLLTPALINYSQTALLFVAVGLYFSSYLTVNLEKAMIGLLLSIGLTMIPAAGTVDFSLALIIVVALVSNIALAIVCQWIVYPWLPEDELDSGAIETPAVGGISSNWIALRTVLIVLPAFLLLLTNPLMYMPIIIKSLLLGQQGSMVSARAAGRELLGSTFLGGCFAILFWFMLDLFTSLWMFFWWILLFSMYFCSKFYQLMPSRFSASFWQNVLVTMLILLGPAVEDSANGKDVYAAFAVRMGLFIAVTLYAWMAIFMLEQLRNRHRARISPSFLATGAHKC